jgi:hypothetical protein
LGREKGEGKREKGEGRREKGEGRREKGELPSVSETGKNGAGKGRKGGAGKCPSTSFPRQALDRQDRQGKRCR